MEEDKVQEFHELRSAFNEIYATHYWGNDGSTFYSGRGSHDKYITESYADVVNRFIKFTGAKSVVDMGLSSVK